MRGVCLDALLPGKRQSLCEGIAGQACMSLTASSCQLREIGRVGAKLERAGVYCILAYYSAQWRGREEASCFTESPSAGIGR